jgi:hypothetical protein
MLAATETRRRPDWGWAKLAYEQQRLKLQKVRRRSRVLTQPYLIPPIHVAVKPPEPWNRLPADPRRSVYLPPVGSVAWSLLGQVIR